MRHILLLLITNIVLSTLAFSQHTPPFVPQNVTLRIPLFMPGVMQDPLGVVQNDTLIYKLRGQMFGNGLKINPATRAYPLLNPWQTLYEMTKAFRNADKAKIEGLYTADSKSQIRSVLNGPDAQKFFDVVSKAAQNLRLLGGFYYQQGFAVYTEDDEYGLHENYIRKEGNTYKLSGLKDKASTGWNLALYFKYKPAPMLPVFGAQLPDSLHVEDSTVIKFSVPEKGRWGAVYLGVEGPLLLLAQDNGMNDLDPAPQEVAIMLKGNLFFNPGTYEYYISSFNFPTQRVSKSFIRSENMHRIKIIE